MHEEKLKNNGIKFDNIICDPITQSQAITKLNEVERKQAMQKISIRQELCIL